MRSTTHTRRATATTRRPALPHTVPEDLPGWSWAQNRSGETALIAPGGESTSWFVQDAEARALAQARAYLAERPQLLACRAEAAAVVVVGWVARALPSAGWVLHERGQAQLRVATDDAGLRVAGPLLLSDPRPSVVELCEALRAAGAAADLAIDGVAEAARRVVWTSTDLPAQLHTQIIAAGYRHVAAEQDERGTWRHLIVHAAMPTHARRWGTVEELRQFLAALGLDLVIPMVEEPAATVTPGATPQMQTGTPVVVEQAPAWRPGPDAEGVYRRPLGLPELQEVPPDQLVPGWCQPRHSMDQTALDELAASLRENGQIDDVLAFVDADERGGWCLRLIAGHRRRAAALQAGLPTLRVRVVEATALQIDLLAIASNDKREDLSDLERGQHYARMQEQHGLTTVELARRLGETRTVVSQRLMLTRLAPEVQEALEQQQITFSQARGLHEGSEGDHDAQRAALVTLLADLEAGERRGEADAKALARAVVERQAPERLVALGWRLLPWTTPEGGAVLIIGAPTERPAVWTPDQVREVARAGQGPAAGPALTPCPDLDTARVAFARRGWADVDAGGVLAPWVVLATPELRVLHPDEVAGTVAEAQADLDVLAAEFAAAGWCFSWTGTETRWKAARADGLTVGGKDYATARERLATIQSWPSPNAPAQPEPGAQPTEAPSIATVAEDTSADTSAASTELPVEVEAAPASSLPVLPPQLARLGCTLVKPEPGQLAVLSPEGEEIDRQPARHLTLLVDAASREMLGRVAEGYGLRVEEPESDLRYRLCKRGYGWLCEPLSALEALGWLAQAQAQLLQEAHSDRARWAHLRRLCVALGAAATEDWADPRQASYGRLLHPALPEQAACTLPESIAQLCVVVAQQALEQLAQLTPAQGDDLAALRDRAEAMFAELHGTPTQERRYLLLPPPWSAQETVRLRADELAQQVAVWEREARELAGAPVEQEARTTIVERVRLVGDQVPARMPDGTGAGETNTRLLTQEAAPASGPMPVWASSASDAWTQLLAAPDAAAAAQAALRLALQLAGMPVELPTRGRSALRQQVLDLGGHVLRGDGADARPDGQWVVEAPRWVEERHGRPLHGALHSRSVEIEPDELAAWVATWPAPPQEWQREHQVRQRAYAADDALREGDPALALRHLLAAAGAVQARLSEGEL